MNNQEDLTEKEISVNPGRKEKVLRVVGNLSKRWFIEAFSGMAQGLFCTLIAGTIIGQIAVWCGENAFANALRMIANVAKSLMGAGIGVGIASRLKKSPLIVFTAAVTGMIGAFASDFVSVLIHNTPFVFALGKPGNPIGAYVLTLFTTEIASLYAGKTKLDIVLVPLGMMVLVLGGVFLAWPFIKLIELLGLGIAKAIEAGVAVKIVVGIFVAVIMGVLLTMPTSSAAIWVAITLAVSDPQYADALSIAGGAAVAGCAAHMIGFAVASFRENGVSGLLSQGIGTSMLQIPNIMKKPIIMLPEIIASVFSGLAAVLLDLRCNQTGGGMGTSGLVGVFGAVTESQNAGLPGWKIALGVALCLFVIPAAVSFGVSEWMRKKKIIEPGDQKLD